MALSPLPSGGQTWHFSPPKTGAVSGRVGKPAKQGGQSLNQLDWAVTSPPQAAVPFLAHRAEAEASQNKPFYYTVGGLGSVGSWGAAGGLVLKSPGRYREDGAPLI